MSKIIKKQLKRTRPVIAGFLILNIFTYAVFFNLQLNLVNFSWLTDAKADTATSSVTVKNAPPAFTVNAAESPASASTTPINAVTGSISFTGTANDPESNNYYLIVCDVNTATPGAGGSAPSCGGGNTISCVSGSTVSGAQATCTYNNIANPGAETKTWYAFACDNHGSEPDCTAANQGSGNSGSPYYVNRPSVFTAITTTVDNQNPGGTFTIRATTTDPDTEGGADSMNLTVCDNAGWTLGAGCSGVTYCTATSTGPTISCNYTSPIPMAHGPTTYYGYVRDWHNLAATGNSQNSTFTTNNVAPAVTNINFNSGAPITLNIKNATDKVVWASSTSVTDNNGCSDIVDATSTFYYSNNGAGYNCAADPNSCYKIGSGSCAVSSCIGTTGNVACSGSLAFHSIPTDNATGSPYSTHNWLAAITVYDETLWGIGTSSGVELVSVAALDVNEATIPYGVIQTGQNTGLNNATTTVVNFGNTPLANDIWGTWMSQGGNNIAASNQKFDLNSVIYGSLANTLTSTTPYTTLNLLAPRPTSATDVNDQIFWGINIPIGVPSGNYTGTNSFIAAIYSGGTW